MQSDAEVFLQRADELIAKLQGGLPAISLSSHPALCTAYLNDVDGNLIVAQQVYGYGKPGDVFLGISTSGNAKNVMYAVAVAKAKGMKVAALVGYTSAGKSSIENALTDAGILEDAMLFSTLDTTTRSLTLDNTQEILLTDTVGFIRKLPHHLVEAFKSTLEEAKYADIIIHVVDASNPQMDEQMYVVYDTLRQLGVENRPVITLFNKQDRLEHPGRQRDFQADYSIPTSAKTGQGLEELKKALLEILRRDQIYIERLYDFSEAGKIQMIRNRGQLISEEYVPEGIEVKAYVPKDVYGRL